VRREWQRPLSLLPVRLLLRQQRQRLRDASWRARLVPT
jgi:hypothetical protein